MKLLCSFAAVAVCALAADPKSPPSGKAADPARASATTAVSRPALTNAAARRNENVAIIRIDNDAMREANVRLGNNFTLVPQPPVEVSSYASEHGRPLGESIALRPAN
ncbi:MAG: hypothetical protein JNL98_40345, partial [Bryobacterales bacterium]|nr:hypothetical protein [Bryobacterales bacterium]